MSSTWTTLIAAICRPPSPLVSDWEVARPYIDALNAAINAELGTPAVREKIGLEGGVTIGGTPEHFADVIKADAGKWTEVVRASGAKVD